MRAEAAAFVGERCSCDLVAWWQMMEIIYHLGDILDRVVKQRALFNKTGEFDIVDVAMLDVQGLWDS